VRRGRGDDGSAGRHRAGGRVDLEALDFRRAMKKIDQEWGKDWWFQVWGPDSFNDEGMGQQEDWMIRAEDDWHGFGDLVPASTC
jgi:hypothetical protein